VLHFAFGNLLFPLPLYALAYTTFPKEEEIAWEYQYYLSISIASRFYPAA
jgi:hypothetical protein